MNKFQNAKWIFGFIMLIFSPALFSSSVSDSHYYAALYTGIFQGDFNNSYLDLTNSTQQNIVQSSQQHGYIGGFAIGNSVPFYNQYFVGGELAGNLDSHTASFQSGASNAIFSDNVQAKYHVDLLIVPGVAITETLATYIKLGLSYVALNDTVTSRVSSVPTTFDSNRNVLGMAAGVGLEKFINDKIFLFFEGHYHDYGTVDFSDFQNVANYSHSSHVYTYSFVAGAGYVF